jgi:hypothetical protein
MSNNCAFVFAVCGTEEHINTLNFSLIPLLKRTKHPVYVVTDLGRNTGLINHFNIIDVKTPANFTNHQASIFLKTSLHKILPNGVNYCYIDSDVLAIGNYIDNIFDEFVAPIKFALDHCTSNYFSPIAMNCECTKEFDFHKNYIDENADEFAKSIDDTIIESREKLNKYFKGISKNYFLRFKLGLLFYFSINKVKVTENAFYHKQEKVYKDNNGLAFMRHYKLRKVAVKLGYGWNYWTHEPLTKDGVSTWKVQCTHLHKAIKTKFNIDIDDKKFHHYNGGVFLFNNSSHEFLDFWHNATLEIFKDAKWKTRDQGTLIATTWRFNRQKSKPLNSRWNYIIDFNNPKLNIQKIIEQHRENHVNKAPQFLHVYHHFQDYDWHVWNSIEQLL